MIISVAITTKLPPESYRYCASVPRRDKSFISSPYRLWSTPILVLNRTACPVPWVKQASSPVEVKNAWSYTYIPLCAFMEWRGTTLHLPYTCFM